MKTILVFADWFEPGFKAGGPIRSCVNFTRQMQDAYKIYVFTSDRDLGDGNSYPGIRPDTWTDWQQAKVYYCSPGKQTTGVIREQLAAIRPDFIYLNSMFSKHFTIYPLWLSRSNQKATVILSPRGMLRESALRFKPLKKKAYLFFLRFTGLPKKIHFLASDETEEQDIGSHFGKQARVTRIPNLPAPAGEKPAVALKTPGELSMIFVGRIHPIKNLDYLLEVLKTCTGIVRLSIVGSLEDKEYWQKCQTLIGELPGSIRVEYLGEMPNDQLPAVIRKHHIFILPTKGENFGHAIFEALSLGKPVLISDQTPWRNLPGYHAGWDLPLEKPSDFAASIATARDWDQDRYAEWSAGAFALAAKKADNKKDLEKYQELFS